MRGLSDRQGWLTIVKTEGKSKSESRRWLELLGPVLSIRKEVGGVVLGFVHMGAAIVCNSGAQPSRFDRMQVRTTPRPHSRAFVSVCLSLSLS